ncbi:MAG: hypothetical protein ABI402_02115 [Ferruginibacter sp.]
MNLTCKIQNNNFEAGEFTDVKQVDYSAAINIIEHFPWEKQREHIVIELTNPSVSFECSPDCILKLALFFNHKFVLHFFDGEHLYTKSFTDCKQAYPFIEFFFVHQTIDLSIFKKENTWLKKISHHFRTGDFVYSVEKKKIWQLLDYGTIISLIMNIVLVTIFMLDGGTHHNKAHNDWKFILIFFPVFFLYGGINYILLLNYYLASRNKTLKLTRGDNVFLWGNNADLKEYKKTDVIRILIKKNKGSRCPWETFALSFLFFNDGTYIKIPSMILSDSDIQYKMFPLTSEIKQSIIPFCKLGE